MPKGSVYIVDLEVAVKDLERSLGHPELLELPTIDLDVVKWRVLEMFLMQTPREKLMVLNNMAINMTRGDTLFDKEEFFESTPWQRQEAEKFMRDYIKHAIIRFGQNCYAILSDLGLIITGNEQYSVIHQPLTNETYLFTRI